VQKKMLFQVSKTQEREMFHLVKSFITSGAEKLFERGEAQKEIDNSKILITLPPPTQLKRKKAAIENQNQQ
jgi:hypothetical protein